MSQSIIEQMLNHRLHIGHLSSRWHPAFAPFILTKRNDRHIIDLRKTYQQLQEATRKLQEVAQGGGKILFVGTKRQARSSIIQTATTLGASYMVERWLGGTLTNFSTIHKSIKKMAKMDDIEDSIAYKNLTKKEQGIKQGKKVKLQRNLAGIQELRRLPQAVFVIDIKREATAIKEAQKLGIPILAIVDTNTNPQLVDYPIAANDDTKESIAFILDYIAQHVKPSVEAWKASKDAATQQPTATVAEEKGKAPTASRATTVPTKGEAPAEPAQEEKKVSEASTKATTTKKTKDKPADVDTPRKTTAEADQVTKVVEKSIKPKEASQAPKKTYTPTHG